MKIALAGASAALSAGLVFGLLPTTALAAPPPSVTVAQIAAKAPVPSACRMPATTLVRGKSPTKYLPRRGTLVLTGANRAVSVDLNRDGAREVVATYACNAGGVQWPNVILAYRGSTSGPRLLGALNLGTVSDHEHSNVTWWARSGAAVAMSWVSYDGAGFHPVFHWSAVKATGSRLSLSQRYRPATGDTLANRTTDAFLQAATRGDRATMRRLATPKALAAFDQFGRTWSLPSRSSISENGGTFHPVTTASILSGKKVPGNYGLIFGFKTSIATTGSVRITAIESRGDAG